MKTSKRELWLNLYLANVSAGASHRQAMKEAELDLPVIVEELERYSTTPIVITSNRTNKWKGGY